MRLYFYQQQNLTVSVEAQISYPRLIYWNNLLHLNSPLKKLTQHSNTTVTWTWCLKQAKDLIIKFIIN